jgi:hypothetical protein
VVRRFLGSTRTLFAIVSLPLPKPTGLSMRNRKDAALLLRTRPMASTGAGIRAWK